MNEIETATDTLHMVQCWLDPRRLVQLGKMHKLPLAQTDTNYLVHCALGRLFGDDAPKPFFVDDDPRTVEDTARQHPSGRHLRVLGYADINDEALREEAKLSPNPTVGSLCDWSRFCSHEMPKTFREERRLQFELRACPVVRKSSGGPKWNAGQELDAFLSHVWELDDPDIEVSREDVYRDWLTRQLDQRGGAEASGISMERFSIERMTRRTYGSDRKTKTIQRPDVTLTGALTVTDGAAFTNLLRSGIGRHKSFGYGMLKVRRT
jgi:CRISPR system Cascade subunit CasE